LSSSSSTRLLVNVYLTSKPKNTLYLHNQSTPLAQLMF